MTIASASAQLSTDTEVQGYLLDISWQKVLSTAWAEYQLALLAVALCGVRTLIRRLRPGSSDGAIIVVLLVCALQASPVRPWYYGHYGELWLSLLAALRSLALAPDPDNHGFSVAPRVLGFEPLSSDVGRSTTLED